MDAGTLADLIKAGPIPENVLARLTAQVIIYSYNIYIVDLILIQQDLNRLGVPA